MTKFPIYALTITALAAPTAAYPTDFKFWDCPGDVHVSVTFTAPWKTVRHYYHHEISIDGLRDLVKDRVTFKPVTKSGYLRAYLNGKPCQEKNPYEEKPKPPPLTADDERALALRPEVPILPPPEYDGSHNLTNWLDGLTDEELVAYCNDPKAIWLLQVGCAKPHASPCKIYLAREEVITAAGLTVNLVKRHMNARCNGWPAP